jgi:hypothetical protein
VLDISSNRSFHDIVIELNEGLCPFVTRPEPTAGCLAIDHRQRMTQLESGISLVPDIQEAEHFRQALLFPLERNAIGVSVVLATVMPQRLEDSDLVHRLANGSLI